jgi:hypothetical protein
MSHLVVHVNISRWIVETAVFRVVVEREAAGVGSGDEELRRGRRRNYVLLAGLQL